MWKVGVHWCVQEEREDDKECMYSWMVCRGCARVSDKEFAVIFYKSKLS